MKLKIIATILLAVISCSIIAKGVDSQALINENITHHHNTARHNI